MLEWPRLLSYLAGEALSAAGKERCTSLCLADSATDVAQLLDETQEAFSLLTNRSQLLVDRVPDIRVSLELLGAGASLHADDLTGIGEMLSIASRVNGSLSLLDPDTFPRLTVLAESLHPLASLRKELSRCLSEDGSVKDEASSDLRRLRGRIRKLHAQIKEELTGLIHSRAVSDALQEPIFTQRNGRYVLPVEASKRSGVRGIVHDSSQSGLTVYVEPMSVVEPTNNIRLAESEEEREIQRILTSLTEQCRSSLRELSSTFETLTQIDVILSKARLALKYDGIRPELAGHVGAADSITLVGSRHPLLVLQGDDVVANDVTLGGSHRTLVITGPNTGGKTVLLKQVGLLSLMTRAGLLIPARPGSKLPVFTRIWADIGDEQSLEQSLSTFSSHMTNIVEIVDRVGEGMLVLLDEIGVGTDPREGAAIARAVLEHLNATGCMTISTTHFGELKVLAYSEDGFINGSLAFDENTLAPSYRLSLGVPGSSKGVVIAERLGLKGSVIEATGRILSEHEDNLERTMKELQSRLDLAAARQSELDERSQLLEEEKTDLQARRLEMDEELARLKEEVSSELTVRSQEALARIKELTRELQKTPSLAKAQKAKEEIEKIRAELDWQEPIEEKQPGLTEVSVGQRVLVVSLNQAGTVESFTDREGVATVRVGSMKVSVPVTDLRATQSPVPAKKKRRTRPAASASKASRDSSGGLEHFIRTSVNTLDLRGKRVDESLALLDEFLDGCSIASISPVMIIHGHGTGAIKRAVRDYLSDSRYAFKSRPGELYEGGDGVTIVELR